ncbi:DUF4330 domain-containing protein [Anaerosalibacter bizertensis]|uniref:DUF4330 domain-containing protein n=1 Tax=Anaerosalibacter bizertensis TaxID=932217 RepID=A0A9Q4AAK0_9FIRM|nr:DUF4330 domain-containing protein [Anaerosalibacter bizertensis]MCB5558756.1 DUF4330 domain-containing protein [Anaerosalibacter bizertensis]MCG4564086.1 DUF4330 domain-containing protein [Anaerosalibacter bizertensis]MCG4582329.1 DUF4330 domain-containing protein [Anaerosalibacter bizertensis]MCG4583956.1 DUF4330 domain-containing protein [Anaerosalibacter bizertensis]
MIDKEGRIFGKINILDFIFIVLIVVLVFLSSLKLLNKDVSDLASKDELVTVEVETSAIMDKGYFEVVKVGDKLGETKQYLDATIKDIKKLPVEESNLDIDGNTVVSVDPLKEKAVITFEATVPYEKFVYKFGKQELRQGKAIFIESDLYRYKAKITNLKVVE